MRQDNILYFENGLEEDQYFELSIRHYEKEKERISVPLLKEGCYTFNVIEYFEKNLNQETRKKLYNKLGGYIENSHIQDNTKIWIKKLPLFQLEELIQTFCQLPYEEQRKIKAIIYEEQKKEIELGNHQILKKTQGKVA